MEEPKKLPQNIEAEQVAISLLSQIEECMTAFAWTEDLFLNPTCRRLFTTISELRRLGRPVNAVSIITTLEQTNNLELNGGQHGVCEILEKYPVSPSANPLTADMFYEDLVAANQRREMIRVWSENEPDIYAGTSDTLGIVDKLSDATNHTESRRKETIKQQISKLIDQLEQRQKPEAFELGLKQINDFMYGGVHRGELVTIAGPTGGGKSLMLAMAALASLRNGKKVVFFSLEMPGTDIIRRLASNLANTQLPRPGDEVMEGQLRSIRPALMDIAKWNPIIIDSLSGLHEIEAEARRLVKLGKVDLMIVDYIQKVRHSGGERRELDVAEVTSRLKALALNAGVGIITASQLNKQGDVRESSAVEFDSDCLLKIIDGGLLCQKFRRGPSGWMVPMKMNGALGRFDFNHDYEPEDEKPKHTYRKDWHNK